jgi:hypothetical protein
MNPFLELSNRNAWGPGSFEMALPLVEIGGGSGQISSTIAKY